MSSLGMIVWFTGLPGSGKSTLAAAVARELAARTVAACILDGDEIRDALVPRPGYTPVERSQFYRTLANLGGVLARQGLVVLIPATANERSFRDHARAASERFLEVHLATPLAICRDRDFKGTYRADPAQVPGLGVAYEAPQRPDVIAQGGEDRDALTTLVARITAPHRDP